jgi:hypothetical protein
MQATTFLGDPTPSQPIPGNDPSRRAPVEGRPETAAARPPNLGQEEALPYSRLAGSLLLRTRADAPDGDARMSALAALVAELRANGLHQEAEEHRRELVSTLTEASDRLLQLAATCGRLWSPLSGEEGKRSSEAAEALARLGQATQDRETTFAALDYRIAVALAAGEHAAAARESRVYARLALEAGSDIHLWTARALHALAALLDARPRADSLARAALGLGGAASSQAVERIAGQSRRAAEIRGVLGFLHGQLDSARSERRRVCRA